jgi:hypothetical protein
VSLPLDLDSLNYPVMVEYGTSHHCVSLLYFSWNLLDYEVYLFPGFWEFCLNNGFTLR